MNRYSLNNKRIQKGFGLVEVIVLVLVILILGAAAFFYFSRRSAIGPDTGLTQPTRLNLPKVPSLNPTGGPTEPEALPTLSDDDTTTTLEKELNAVNLGDIDQDFQEIERDIKGL